MSGTCLISFAHDRLQMNAPLTHRSANGHAVPENIVNEGHTQRSKRADQHFDSAGVSENNSSSPGPRASPSCAAHYQPDHQCNPHSRSQLTRLRSGSRPAINPHFPPSGILLRDHFLQSAEESPPDSPATVASRTNNESFELYDFTEANYTPGASTAEAAPARAQNLGVSRRPFHPSSNSQSLAGLPSGPYTDWHKTDSPENRPWGSRSTRLRFWTEALKRRANPKNEAQVDLDPEAAAKMKFSHSIQFNAVPDWSTSYIAYSNLKKM